MHLETFLGSVRCVPDLSGLVAALGHEPLLEPVPDSAWNKPSQRLLEVTAVGRADGLPWLATASQDPRQDAVRLARRIRARGAAAVVLALDPAGRRLAIAAAFDRLPHLELDLANPDPEAIDSLARLAGTSGAGPMAFAARVADALSTEPVGRRFFREFRTTLDRMAGELPCPMPPLDRHAYALLQLTRVLFLYFIQTRGWLAGRERFLAEEVDRCMARNERPERPLKPVTAFSVLPVAISSRATAAGSVLPALLFQITKPQPGSSRDQHEKPLRFSTMSWPQTGHGPRLARGMRTSLSFASSSATVPRANSAMSAMNFSRFSSPCSIFDSRCSQSPVSPGDVSGCPSSRRITLRPFSVQTSERASRSM